MTSAITYDIVPTMSSKKNKSDPYRSREEANYTKPIASREFIIHYLEELDKPATFEHLQKAFEIKDPDATEALERRLKAMERDGQLICNRRGSYALVEKLELIKGRVELHRDGYGFLIPDDQSPDIFLPARQVRGLMEDDKVLVRASGEPKSKKRTGVVVEVLAREARLVVGRFYQEDALFFVSPDNRDIPHDIIIAPDQIKNAKSGDYVEVTVLPALQKRHQPMGKVEKVLGNQLTPGMEVDLAARAFQLPFEFSEDTVKLAEKFPKVVGEADLAGRVDLRTLSFVTIDGEDAKDFDDAVYCEPHSDGWKLWVAIADVSYYVQPETPLDRDAVERGNSVYFPARVIPMLPEALSNRLCSLIAKEDRLSLVCEMKISKDGLLKKFEFYEAVIHSHARLTYTVVAQFLSENATQIPDALHEPIRHLNQLYVQLVAQRQLRGAIDFDTVETQIIFDDKGKIKEIIPRRRNVAHCIIEEMMLLANVSAARFLEKAKIPTLYRNHPEPSIEKLTILRDFLKTFSLKLSGSEHPKAMDYGKLLQRLKGRPDAHLLQTVLLRSMQQADYGPDNIGHFGLAFPEYTHFTSPIRRYPDLLVHRAIKYVLSKKSIEKFPYSHDEMIRLGGHFSSTERRADKATRQATDWLKCDYMKEKIGQTFDALIVEVTGFGVFVELKNIYAQGLVHITALPNDYYHFESARHCLVGKRSGRIYRLGDSVHVLLTRVNLDERQIDFEVVGRI